MAVSDDDIIKRKLLIEGDGGSDDRKISNLLKTFIKWSNDDSDAEESKATCQRMLATLSQTEFSMEKSLQIYNMNLQEEKSYTALQKQIEENIQDACEKITACKKELHNAKLIRRNRQEYDALAKVIQQHPDRQETLKQLEVLDSELKGMKETKESLGRKLELRKKQFHVLITSIHQLQLILEEDEKEEEADTSSTMDTT